MTGDESLDRCVVPGSALAGHVQWVFSSLMRDRFSRSGAVC